jgi:hypothetical protein
MRVVALQQLRPARDGLRHAAKQDAQSEHLLSRRRTGERLRAGSVPVTEMRAGKARLERRAAARGGAQQGRREMGGREMGADGAAGAEHEHEAWLAIGIRAECGAHRLDSPPGFGRTSMARSDRSVRSSRCEDAPAIGRPATAICASRRVCGLVVR